MRLIVACVLGLAYSPALWATHTLGGYVQAAPVAAWKGAPGTFRHTFDGSALPVGTYLIGAESKGRRVVRKVLRP